MPPPLTAVSTVYSTKIWMMKNAKEINCEEIPGFSSQLAVRVFAAARLAQWDKRRPVERKAVGSNPGRTNAQGL